AASLLDDSFPAGRPEDLNEAVGLRDDVARRWAGKYLGRDPEEAALDFAAETLRPGGLVFRPRRCRQLFDLVSDAFGFDELRSAVSEVLSELRDDDEHWEPSE